METYKAKRGKTKEETTPEKAKRLRKNIVLFTATLRILENNLLDSDYFFQQIKLNKELLRRLLYD
jgi:hypothetical protein